MLTDESSVAAIGGLTESDAQARLKADGYNELPRPGRRTPFRIVFEVLREPMMALLSGGGVIYLALGDRTEALIHVLEAKSAFVLARAFTYWTRGGTAELRRFM
jgi:Ca2+-transporting ATPase